MTGLHLHILSFNVPYPPDYGGVVDVFAKIKALHAEGVRIHLHCFAYGRPEAIELNAYCESVHYYPRRTGPKGFSWTQPYIVHSRSSNELLSNLDKDNFPILAEGIHSSWVLAQKKWPGRSLAIRLHNVEADYYAALAAADKNPLRKAFFQFESRRLSEWEANVRTMDLRMLAIHPQIVSHFNSPNVVYCPAFTNYEPGGNLLNKGEYVLFHGDLSVPDNQRSLEWLLQNVWTGIGLPWVIAGRNPSARLRRFLSGRAGVRLEANPSEKQMDSLIQDAQVHLIHSFNPTGIKIKLLHALFRGRHCIAHRSLLEQTGLEQTCHSALSADEFRQQLNALSDLPFSAADLALRTKVLSYHFDNRVNARRIMEWMR